MESKRSTDQTNPEAGKQSPVVVMELSTEEAFRDYTIFVMSCASEGNKSKDDQIGQGCIGMCTEAGELLDNYKKFKYHGRDFDRVNALEECGDSFFYMTELLHALGSSIFEVMEINIKKLTQRYKGKRLTAERSLGRDVIEERKVMEDKVCDTCAETEVCPNKAMYEGSCCAAYHTDKNNMIANRGKEPEHNLDPVPTCSNCVKSYRIKDQCNKKGMKNCTDHEFIGSEEASKPLSYTCTICGGSILGDGHNGVYHCENAEIPSDIEPDADVILCEGNL